MAVPGPLTSSCDRIGFVFVNWYRQRVSLFKLQLMPVWVGAIELAGAIELFNLRGGEIPADGGEILAKLLFIARADDDGRDGGTLDEPVEGDLGNGFAGFRGDGVERIDDGIDVLIVEGRAVVGGVVETADFGQGLAAADFAGEASPTEGTPDERADFLVEAEGHQLPLVVTADERVVDLMSDVAGEAVTVRDGERLHQVPAGEIGAGDVADFAFANELVEGVERLFDGREGVEGVHVVDVDVIGLEAAQTAFDLAAQVITRGAFVVRAVAHAEGGLGRDKCLIAIAFEGFAEDLFGATVAVDVRGVEEIDADFKTDVEQMAGFFYVSGAPCAKEISIATEGSGAEAEDGDFEAGASEDSVFHGRLDAASCGADAEMLAPWLS
jgi:hypothetical protein